MSGNRSLGWAGEAFAMVGEINLRAAGGGQVEFLDGFAHLLAEAVAGGERGHDRHEIFLARIEPTAFSSSLGTLCRRLIPARGLPVRGVPTIGE
jgi:hypothetical protein